MCLYQTLQSQIEAFQNGHEGLTEALLVASDSVVAESLGVVTPGSKGRGAVCSRVKIQLSQSIVLTRSAFEASLTLTNPSGQTMSAVNLTLGLYDLGSRTATSDRFAVKSTSTEGFGQVRTCAT